MAKARPLILVADAEESTCCDLAALMAMYNYEVQYALDTESAKQLAGDNDFDALVISLEIPGGGFHLSQEIKGISGYESVPVLFITDEDYDSAMLMEAQFYGGLFLHRKPCREVLLLSQLSSIVRIKLLQDELKERMEELDTLASFDPLTELYNRRMFFIRLEEELSRCARRHAPVVLVYMDIDFFKVFNDKYGHLAGDYILQQVSEIMQTIVRRSDVLGRIGGEEFVLLLPETTAQAGIAIAERIRRSVEESEVKFDGKQLGVTISAGVVCIADAAEITADELIRQADELMYEAKGSGRNNVIHKQLSLEY